MMHSNTLWLFERCALCILLNLLLNIWIVSFAIFNVQCSILTMKRQSKKKKKDGRRNGRSEAKKIENRECNASNTIQSESFSFKLHPFDVIHIKDSIADRFY